MTSSSSTSMEQIDAMLAEEVLKLVGGFLLPFLWSSEMTEDSVLDANL